MPQALKCGPLGSGIVLLLHTLTATHTIRLTFRAHTAVERNCQMKREKGQNSKMEACCCCCSKLQRKGMTVDFLPSQKSLLPRLPPFVPAVLQLHRQRTHPGKVPNVVTAPDKTHKLLSTTHFSPSGGDSSPAQQKQDSAALRNRSGMRFLVDFNPHTEFA